MSKAKDNWTTQLTTGGAVLGAIVGYIALSNFFEQPDANAAEAGGLAMASTMLGILVGSPVGAGIGFISGKVLDKLNIKH